MAYLKTVRKWADEFEIDIGYKLDENSLVIEMWCNTCRDFCKDKSSLVGGMFYFSILEVLEFVIY